MVLLARFISVELSLAGLHHFKKWPIKTGAIMSWAGLRGGVSIALALSLPDVIYREILLHLTYLVVIFSIVVQGLTLPKVIKKWYQ